MNVGTATPVVAAPVAAPMGVPVAAAVPLTGNWNPGQPTTVPAAAAVHTPVPTPAVHCGMGHMAMLDALERPEERLRGLVLSFGRVRDVLAKVENKASVEQLFMEAMATLDDLSVQCGVALLDVSADLKLVPVGFNEGGGGERGQ